MGFVRQAGWTPWRRAGILGRNRLVRLASTESPSNTSRNSVENEGLADRLTSYSDALVATSFVMMTAVGLAVGDPDIRCELADAAFKVGLAVLVTSLAMLYALRWLRRWENRLRPSEAASEDAATVQERLHVARIVLVVLFLSCTFGLVLMSLTDQSCLAALRDAAM